MVVDEACTSVDRKIQSRLVIASLSTGARN